MRNFTFILASALVLGGLTANAQTAAKHKRLLSSFNSQLATAAAKPYFNNSADVRKSPLRIINKVGNAQYKPKQESVYEYDAENSQWVISSVFSYEYDKEGRVVKQTEVGDDVTVTEVAYSDDGLTETNTQSVSTDGGKTYVNTNKRVQIYDPVATDLVVEKLRYEWDAAANEWVATTDAYKREITRDGKNNVLALQILVPYEGNYDATERYTNTVDETTGQIDSYKYERLGYDENFQPVWETQECLTGITWEKTNGQLVSQYNEWMQWGNYIKTAKLTDLSGDEPLDFCDISVEYKGDGGYKEVFAYTDEPETTVTEKTMTDANGSFTLETKTTMQADDAESEEPAEEIADWTKEVVEYDAHGNITLDDMYMLGEEEPVFEKAMGYKYEYTYDADHGDEIKEMVNSEYNYDTQSYDPMMRVLVDEYVDITSGISAVNADAASAKEMYNLQGVRMSAASAGKGIFIVRNGGKTVKILR